MLKSSILHPDKAMLMMVPVKIFLFLFLISDLTPNFNVDSAVTCDTTTMFLCEKDDRCIPNTWICDEDNDCTDGSDEATCHKRNCTSEQHKCKGDKNKCIPKRWKCDGERDCEEGDDEDNCQPVKCNEQIQMPCKTNRGNSSIVLCIPLSWKCDHQRDCEDGSDEQDCPKAGSPLSRRPGSVACRDNEYTCDNGNCIFKDWACDFDNDCGDNSDEMPKNKNCPKEAECQEGYFSCKGNRYCIPKRWMCDGEHDCEDSSDETDPQCSGTHPLDNQEHHMKCNEHQFACKTGHCINKEWVCDGDNDCPDQSDEANVECSKDNQTLFCDHDSMFKCSPKHHSALTAVVNVPQCISKLQVCDGQEDCEDGADEKECTNAVSKPECDPSLHFDCGNGKCLKWEFVCDGKKDCERDPLHPSKPSADEPDEECLKKAGDCSKNNGECHHTCRSVHGGRLCQCHDGHFKVNDTQCQDFDECQSPGKCSQICTNMPGSYRCSCHKDYLLQADLKTCRALSTDGVTPKLLISNRAHIREIDLSTKEYLPLVDNLHSAVAMDFVYKDRTVVWSDVSSEKINMCKLPDHKKGVTGGKHNCTAKTLVGKNISTPDGLAIDWVHKLLFWTDTGLDQISVINMEKSPKEGQHYRKVLFHKELDEPRAIAVDPKNALIFWTDWGAVPKIERATMDGGQRKVIVRGNIRWPNGLALDLLAKRVYWADAKLKMISSANYDGSDVLNVLQSWHTLKHPFSLSVFEEKMYWTDWDTEGVHSANKFTGRNQSVVANGLFGPMTVRVFHQLSQPDVPNKCQFHRCHQLCLPRPVFMDYDGRLDGGDGRYQDWQTGLEGDPEANARAQHQIESRLGPSYSCHCADEYFMSTDGKSCLPVGQMNNGLSPDSESSLSIDGGGGMTMTLTAVIALILIVLALMGWIFWRRSYHNGALRGINFDNPIYRRTVEEVDVGMSGGGGAGQYTDNPAGSGQSDMTSDYQPAMMDDEVGPGIIATSASMPHPSAVDMDSSADTDAAESQSTRSVLAVVVGE